MEERGEGGGEGRPRPPRGDLGDIVLDWSLGQILDENLFENQVVKIPSMFISIEHYFGSFAAPLMEETRAEIHSSLDDISKAPRAKIIAIEKGQRKSETTQEYYVDVEFIDNHIDCGSQNYKARNGDLFILSSMKPEAVNDFNRYNVACCLALVTEVSMDDGVQKGFVVKLPKIIDVEYDMGNFKIALFLTNLLTNFRIWKALCVTSGTNNNIRIINEVVSPRPMVSATCNTSLTGGNDYWFTKLSDKLCSFNLNLSQIEAVQAAIHAAECRDSHCVELVWGPPGTGKTKTVSAMLWAFLHMKCRTLTCAPTNVAVVGVCSRLLQLIKYTAEKDKLHGLPSSLGDVLLFGNRERMEIDDELQDVFLDYRVEQLLDCFAPSTGLKCRISSVVSLLEDCSCMYHMFLENSHKEEALTFTNFFRKQFDAVVTPLENCIRNLWIHTNCISSRNATEISSLLNLLEIMHNLLCDEELGDDELKDVLLPDISKLLLAKNIHGLVSPEHGFSTSKQLSEARVESLRLLIILQSSLLLPNTVDSSQIRAYCLRSATLIFCTASSSSMLHHVEMKPLHIVVIDEAAQLKECESVIPLRLNMLNTAILVGDECQLPSTVKSQVSKDAGFGVSLFERLSSVGQRKHLLNMQYRMHPSISLFPNFRFYKKQILDCPNVEDINYNKSYKDLKFGAYAFINVADGREEVDEHGNSKRNLVEVVVVLHLIRRLYIYWEASGQILSIGVISPYSYQVNAIMERLGNKYEAYDGFRIRVKSIDGFQGEEDDVIILSTVRSSDKANIGFLQDHQRTNVALTRARHCLWIVGNAKTLERSDTIWKYLVLDAKARKCYFNANDDATLSKSILHAKHKLDQLDDLLRSDSVLLSSSRWKVLFSDDFKKSFSRLRHFRAKKEVIHLLLSLSNGLRSKSQIRGISDSFDLVRIYKVMDLYLIWTVDIIKDERYVQVIKVWDLLPLEQIARLVSRLDYIFSTYTEVYLKHCKAAFVEGNLEVPMSWNVVCDMIRYKTVKIARSTMEEDAVQLDSSSRLEDSKVNESLLLMKFYSLSSRVVRHLLTANDGTDIVIPFELTDQEKEITQFPLSTFILGRSGTGKTTILTTKLVQKEQLHSISSEGFSEKFGLSDAADRSVVLKKHSSPNKGHFLRQVFLTVSSKLCSAIRSHICQLQSIASGCDFRGPAISLEMNDKNELSDLLDIPDSLSSLKQEHYPLVITFRKFLMMLDGTLNSFFDKYYSKWGFTPNQRGCAKSCALHAFIQSKEVNYEKFVGSYWPHFNEQLTKTVNPSTVFTQIISHIKGGLDSVTVHAGKLKREDYLLLSEKRVSTLSRQARETIYDIFIDYENIKLLYGEYDLSDFVNDLHQQLACNGYAGDMIDFVYVDEVQDLTLRQLGLLKYVCKNFEEGYTFAGDTAQTIARGIDFRFEDIRSLFYTEFLSEVKSGYQQKKKEREIHVTDMFQLSQNLRTHAGVLGLAQSIMDLLYYYFPLSIDKLIPEFSLIYGETPVLLESSNDENAILTIFGKSVSSQGCLSGFGAEQVILVRDTVTKEQIFDQIGKQALVLTILECKGLEFQDVLLYNFFGTSPLKKKWRVTYEFMKHHNILEPSVSRTFPSFELQRHNLLCSELKQLYVAITRTKQRLWICENTNEYSKPMFDYWKRLCLVQERHLDSSLAQAMKVASSAEDWRLRGIELFNEGNFDLAAVCFDKAGDEYNVKWSKAAGLVEYADQVISTNADMGESALKRAAEIYESIDKPESAATCYIKLNDFKQAGMTYTEKCGISRLKDAGDCFAMAECWTDAAHAYAKGKFLSECLSVCSKGGIFEKGLEIIEQWNEASCTDGRQKHELNEMIASYLENCAQHYLELGDIQHMMMFVKAFQSDDVRLRFLDAVHHFLKSNNLLDNLLTVELELGNYIEAASIARNKGNMLLEAEILEKANCFEEATLLLLFHVLVSSLWSSGNKGWPLEGYAEKENHLIKAKELAQWKSGSFQEYVFLEADILSDRVKSLSDMSRHLVEAQKHRNLRQEVFSSRAILDVHIESKPFKFLHGQVSVFDSANLVNDMISQNCLSVDTMMYAWNLWKAVILDLLSYLDDPKLTKDGSRYKVFYLEYFGVRTLDEKNMYFIQNPEAYWVKNTVKFSLGKEKNLICLSASECISCAKSYWSTELFSVGMKLLECLQSLHNFYVEKNLYSFCRGRVAIWVYEVAKFLIESELTSASSMNKSSMNKVRGYYNLSQTWYIDIIFPLDWRDDMMENVLFLHENKTAMEIIDVSLSGILEHKNGNLTHGQIGRLVMLLFVTGQLSDELFKMIVNRLTDMQPWRDFIEQYRTFLNFGFARIPVISKYENALRSSFNIYWKNKIDYLSPHCFIYLIECLMFFASSCRGLGGHFFTTKSSLVEMLKCYGCKGYLTACLSSVPDLSQNTVQLSLGYVIETIKILLGNKHQLFAWMNKSSMLRESYPLLALKLVIMLYLAHLNAGRSTCAIGRFLWQNKIYEVVHKAFSMQPLHQAKFDGPGGSFQFITVFAEALQKVGNSLVIVCSDECPAIFSSLNALTINSEDLRCTEKVFAQLFPEKKMIFQSKHSGREPIEKGSIVIDPSSSNKNLEVDSTPSDISHEKDQDPGLGDREFGKEFAEQYEHFWQKLEEFLSGKYDDVEDTINIFGTIMNWIKQKDQLKDSEGHLMAEMSNLHVELQLLATMRSEGTQEGCPTKADLYSKWKGLRASLEPLMDKLIPQKEAVTKESSPSHDASDIDNTQGCDPNMREAVAIPEASSSSQTKASKQKENKRSRKKNKGKGKIR
ncbi:hypothetical protein OPV22_007040 [Ensete ventricosum]|uniref:UvrD-like helicase ATP-binding domain-containing protein n=1 Tax=Ensete ventricosum TaxID=4639 RepID=A0AAV8RPE2_ENSVE|nr:hypothetical protein OPV22_007040 [Ensete ventricosum]